MRHLQRKRAPLATSGRFFRPNQPETPQHAGVSPGRRSRQRTTPSKTAQKSRTMAKSAPISCETAQKSQGCGRRRCRTSRKRRRVRNQRGHSTRHRGERTSVPCSKTLRATTTPTAALPAITYANRKPITSRNEKGMVVSHRNAFATIKLDTSLANGPLIGIREYASAVTAAVHKASKLEHLAAAVRINGRDSP